MGDSLYLVLELVQLSYYMDEVELRRIMCVSVRFKLLVENELKLRKLLERRWREHELQEIFRRRKCFEKLRSTLKPYDQVRLDEEISDRFNSLSLSPLECLLRLKSLSERGAVLCCPDHELQHNFTSFYQDFVAYASFNKLNKDATSDFFNCFKQLVISNPELLRNKGYVGNGGCRFLYFPLQAFWIGPKEHEDIEEDTEIYRLLRFCLLLQLTQLRDDPQLDRETKNCLDIQDFAVLSFRMNASLSTRNSSSFHWKYKRELLQVLLDVYHEMKGNLHEDLNCQPHCNEIFLSTSSWPSTTHPSSNRTDLLMILFRSPVFQEELDHIMKVHCEDKDLKKSCAAKWTREKRTLRILLGSTLFRERFVQLGGLFVLLEQKDRRSIELLWKLYGKDRCSSLVNEEGDDALIAICKVRGCVQNIARFLIKNGCDLDRENNLGQTFKDVAMATRNKRLLRFLHENSYM